MGWLRTDVPADHPAFGKLSRCSACGPVRERQLRSARVARISADCGLAEQQRREQTFGHFKPYRGNEKALDAAIRFSRTPGPRWLILAGLPGVGKTHLLTAIANVAMGEGVPTFYAHVPTTLDWLREGYDRRKRGDEDEDGTFSQRFERLKTADLLLLDDLAAEYDTGWAVERLYVLVDWRYRYQLPTAITTNKDVTQVRNLSERIYSRLKRYDHSTIVVVDAEPYDEWKQKHQVIPLRPK